MDREQLMQIPPHRDGMLLLDSAERQDDCARGRYTVRGDEWFLQGHFPGNPVVPGVMLCETGPVLLRAAGRADGRRCNAHVHRA